MMNKLSTRPEVIQLAEHLQVSTRGDCIKNLRDYALNAVKQILSACPIQANSIGLLLKIVCNELSVKVELIETDEDIRRISEEYGEFNSTLARTLEAEFVRGSTEGITLRSTEHVTGFRNFLAIIDARGERRSRAHFTTWHEIVHLLLPTKDQEVEIIRRTPNQEVKKKDPIESVIDHVAGYLAIYEPIFKPVLLTKVNEVGFSFEAVEQARDYCLPDASLLSTMIRSINFIDLPILLLQIDTRYKKEEEKRINSPQLGFNFFVQFEEPKLRVVRLIRNERAKSKIFAIHENMRVPDNSALSMAYYNATDNTSYQAEEDQSWWNTSKSGALPGLPINVQATRRGRFVYGLIIRLP